MKITKTTGMLAGVTAISLAQLPLKGDTYQYIITDGYDPIVASRADSSTSESSGTALMTGTLSAKADTAVALESRFCTWDESVGTRLWSTKPGFMVTFK